MGPTPESAGESRATAAAAPAAGQPSYSFGSLAIRGRRLQPKLAMGGVGDQYEVEADAVAERVMRAAAPGTPEAPGEDDERTRRVADIICPDCADESVQRAPAGGGTPVLDAGLESDVQAVRGGGSPLDGATRSFFESRMGYDFSAVRIHTDARAAATADQLHALAYAVGPDIVFNAGRFAPQSDAGKRLLAHELTHVVQQGAATAQGGATRTATAGPAVSPARMLNRTEIRMQAGPTVMRHTKAKCDDDFERCCDGCRRLPANARRRRALCWAACMAAYATCLASSDEALTFAVIVAAIVLASADGPFPIGDAAAAALLLSVGIRP